MSDKELNLPDYIDFIYDRFIMTRVEFLIFTQNEQESKVLRVIEWCIENERARIYRDLKAKTPPGQKVEIPEIVWSAISHRFILDQLHGTIQSETTVKEIMASLEKNHFIFRLPGGSGPYDPPIYTINKHLLAQLTALLPASLDDLDMAAIMKQPRKIKKVQEGQKLTPPIIDPLVIKIRETIIAPLDPQLLPLYSPIIAPLSRSTGGQLLPPKRYKEKPKENKEKNSDTLSENVEELQLSEDNVQPLTLSEISFEELLKEVERRKTEQSPIPEPIVEDILESSPQEQNVPAIDECDRIAPHENTAPESAPQGEIEILGDNVTSMATSEQASEVSYSPTVTEKLSRRRRANTRKTVKLDVEQPDLTDEQKAAVAEAKAKEEARLERHRTILFRIILRRGYPLEDKIELMNEHKAINVLMQKYTGTQIDQIHEYLVKEDKYWSQLENSVRVGAQIIKLQAPKVAQILKKRREDLERQNRRDTQTEEIQSGPVVIDRTRKIGGYSYFQPAPRRKETTVSAIAAGGH